MKIAIVALPNVQLLDVVGPADVFAEAAVQLGGKRCYDIEVIGLTNAVVRASNGLGIVVSRSFDTVTEPPDTLLVAGTPDIRENMVNQAFIDWLICQSKLVRRIGSVCSGAFVLAQAGLLDAKKATTHWGSAVQLAKDYPAVEVVPDNIFIRDGNTYTSAGISAGMDLALALVEEDFGRELSLRVAREMVMFLRRPGGQSQFSAHLAAQTAQKSAIRQIQEFILNNLNKDLAVARLALQSGMSERNFSRIFREEAGMTPAQFVETARIDAGRRLLEDSDMHLKRLADELGYASVDAFRRAFVRQVGVGPHEYRKRFSG